MTQGKAKYQPDLWQAGIHQANNRLQHGTTYHFPPPPSILVRTLIFPGQKIF